MKKLKIAVVTYSRADYGIFYPILKKISSDNYFELFLIVTGTHLSQFHGYTIDEIRKDKIPVYEMIEMTMCCDNENSICKSISVGLISFSEVYKKINPDIIMVLGDRYELWSACIPAVIYKIPIAHLHGGELTYGLIDDPVRHSITKMSSIHLASLDVYAKRIIQMGEHPDRVFVVGAPGLDNINCLKLLGKKELEERIGLDFSKKTALLTYHPITLDKYSSAQQQCNTVLKALKKTGLFVIITMPNADMAGNSIYEVINKYVRRYPSHFKLVKNFGQTAYLSAMKYVKLMIGNSSSGVIESASFKLPVINIGDRQKGRVKPKNVINCDCKQNEILKAIDTALSNEFVQSIFEIINPYGTGDASKRIIDILKSEKFLNKALKVKKTFYDIEFKI